MRIIKNKQGYTLIELTVSMAVIVILSSIALVNFSGHDSRNKVDLAAYKLASDIRKVQSYALSLKEFGGVVPAGGWGIRVKEDESKYIIYADKDDSEKYRAGEDATADNERHETIAIAADGIIISEVDIGGATNRNYGYINHIPPNPEIKINGANNENNDVLQVQNVNYIEITLSGSGYSRKVKINKFGLVDVE